MYSNPVVVEDTKAIITEPNRWTELRDSTVVITGAGGMLGSYCVWILLQLNDMRNLDISVVALVRSLGKAEKVFGDILERPDFTLIEQDVSDPLDYGGRADYVIHAASQASPNFFDADPVGTIKANTLGTYHTCDLAIAQKAKAYVFISTREIYGQPDEGQATFTESDWGRVNPLDVRSCYSEGKRAAETICVSYKHQYGLNIKIARLSHTYGPGLSPRDTRVQSNFLLNVMKGENIVLRSPGVLTRTYTYVGDAASAVFWILLSRETEGFVFNIADENSLVSIRELAESFIAARPELGLELVFDIPKESNVGWSPVTSGTLDCHALRGLGWSAKMRLTQGVKRWLRYEDKDI